MKQLPCRTGWVWMLLGLGCAPSVMPAPAPPPAPPAESLRVSLTGVQVGRASRVELTVPVSLLEATRLDFWDRSLEPTEDSDALEKHREKATRTSQQLDQALQEVTTWLAQAPASPSTFDRAQMIRNPYFQLEMVGRLLAGELRRDTLAPAPSSPPDGRALFKLEKREDGFHLDVGAVDVRFPTPPSMDPEQRLRMQSMAESFAHGDAAGVRYYLEAFVARAKLDIARSNDITQQLSELLSSSESMQVTLDLINDGQKTTSVHGAFQLRCESSGAAPVSWLLEAVVARSGAECATAEATAAVGGPLMITVPHDSTVSVQARPFAASNRPSSESTVRGECVVQATTLGDQAVASAPVLVGREMRAEWLRGKLMSGR